MGLFKPTWENKNPPKRMAAVKEITDETLLAKIAKESSYDDVRLAAVERINDQKILSYMLREGNYNYDVRDKVFEKLTDQETLLYFLQDYKGFLESDIIPKLTDETIVAVIKSRSSSRAQPVVLLNCLIERKNPVVFELALYSSNKIIHELDIKEMVENFEDESVKSFVCELFEKVFFSAPLDLVWLHGNCYAGYDNSVSFFYEKGGYDSIDDDDFIHLYWFCYEGSFVGTLLNAAAVTGADMKPVIEKICGKQNETVLLLFLDEIYNLAEKDWPPYGHIELNEKQKETVKSWIPDEESDIIRRLAQLKYIDDIMNTRFSSVILSFYPSFSDFRFDSMMNHFSSYKYKGKSFN